MKKLFIVSGLLFAVALANAASAQSKSDAVTLKPVTIDVSNPQYSRSKDPVMQPSLVTPTRRSRAACQGGAAFSTTPGKGGYELGGGGSLNFGSGATVGNLTAQAGYFLSGPLELGVDVDLIFASGGGGGTDGIVGPFLRYHFNNGNRNVPYLDAGVLFSVGNGFAGNNAIITVGGGIDFFFRANQAAFVEARGLITTGGGDSLGQINFGLRSYFPH